MRQSRSVRSLFFWRRAGPAPQGAGEPPYGAREGADGSISRVSAGFLESRRL